MSNENIISMLKSDEMISKYKDDETFKKNLLDFKIPYREKLNLPDYITMGMEIENNAIKYWAARKFKKVFHPWKVTFDASIPNGCEIISPVLRDDAETWDGLKRVCRLLKEKNTSFDMNPGGGHIHIGAQVFKNGFESILNFIKLWSIYEDVLVEFTRGVYTKDRPSQKHYAGSSRKRIDYVIDVADKYDVGIDIMAYVSRKYALNFSNLKDFDLGKKNTVEIRCPNGTIEEIVWQNNANFVAKFVDFPNNDRFDAEAIDRRYRQKDYAKGFEGACELADLIFDDVFDKICFLRQYIKSDNDSEEFGPREIFYETDDDDLQMVI